MNPVETDPSKARLLFFAPYAGLWPSYRIQLTLAEAWISLGASVTIVGCDGVFDSLCPVMLASHLGAQSPEHQRHSYCRDCMMVRSTAAQKSSVTFLSLDSYVTSHHQKHVDSIVSSVTFDNWRDIELEGIPFGRYSSYLSMLTHKTQDVTETPTAWSDYLADLRNSLLTYTTVPAIADEVQPTHAVVLDRLYPTNRAFVASMHRREVAVSGFTVSSFVPRRLRTVVFHPHPQSSQTLIDSISAREAMEIALSTEEVSDVSVHLSHLMDGNDPWVYTTQVSGRTPADVRRELNVGPESPVVVSLVGSPDETRSSLLVDAEFDRSQGRGYSDVLEFISTCVAAAARTPHIDLVIRLHPRLAPNQRERVMSPDLAAIDEVLRDLPSNVVVNAPGDGIGLHDVMKIAAGGINHASTSGLEFLALGVPVIHVDADRLNVYPPEFGPVVTRGDDEGLAKAMTETAAGEKELVSPVRAWRWLATALLRTPVHFDRVGGAAPAAGASAQVSTHAPRGKQLRKLVPASLREKWSRSIARSTLRTEVISTTGGLQSEPTPPWAWESWDRFTDACSASRTSPLSDRATRDVWEPRMYPRGGNPLGVSDEAEAIHDAVGQLVAKMGKISGPGSGALARWDAPRET